MQMVVFALNGEEYGVDVLAVNGILRSNKFNIKSVPGMPEVIEGIINLRGKVNYIFNLYKIFNLPEGNRTDKEIDEKFIMLAINDLVAGFIVDEVTDIIKFNDDDIESPPALIFGENAGYLKGIVKIDERMVILLNPEKLLSTEVFASIRTAS